MTLDDVTDILNENSAVDAYSIKDDGVRFWVGVRASKDAKQAAVDDVGALDGVEIIHEKVENGWEWYFASIEIDERSAPSLPEGKTCERETCDSDAIRGPGDGWLCREHQREFTADWHG